MKKFLSLLLAFLMVLGLLSGCGAEKAPAVDAEEPSDEVAEARTDVIVQISEEPANLDMTESTTLFATAIAQNIVDTLVTNVNGEVVPMLAESWEWNDTYTQITFTLKDAKFSDGSAITSDDVVYSFELIKEKGIKMAATYALIDSFEAPDAKHVVINLTQAYTPLLNNMCDCAFSVYPKAALESGMDLINGGNVVSGAYYVSEWKTGSSITLTANEYYHDELPLKQITFLFMPDENNSMVSLEAGEIDYMTGTSFALGGTSVQYLQGNGTQQLVQYDSTNYNYIVLNQSVEYFADINVRKAIDCAINRDDMVSVALDGYGSPAILPLLPNMGGYVDGYKAQEQDMAKAKEYLAASKYPNGFTFQLDCPSPTWVKVGQVLQSELKELGITVNINETDIGTQVTNNAANNYEAFVWSFGNTSGDVAGISLIYEPNGPKNYARFSDPTINDAFTKANSFVGAERNTELKVAYDAIIDQCNFLSLYFPLSYQATAAGLKFGDSAIVGSGLPMFSRISW